MNYKMMGKLVAQMLFIETLFMLPAMAICLYYKENAALFAFVQTIVIAVIISGALYLLCKSAPAAIGAKDGLASIGISWVSISLIGCLPFYFSKEIPLFIDAFFEIVSGFTTTGASVVANVEGLSRGILYWRSFSHWLGGMGVLVFLLVIAPQDREGKGFTMHLLRAESPGPNVGKLVPKMRSTAMILYWIYIVLTVLNIIFLVLGKMPLFDALCTALGTAGTGGFGIKNDSLANYSPYLQNATTVFMLLFGVNFGCYYLLLMRQFRGVFKDEELRLYFGLVAACIILIVPNLRGVYDTLEETVRHAAFQVSSIVTTTGYATTDFDLWPAFSKGILLLLMVCGACAGSTGGGLKIIRVILLLKSLRRNIRKVLNPRKVQVIRNNDHVVSEQVLDNTNAYLAAYVFLLVTVVLLISLDNFSFETNFSAALACLNNIGPGMAAVGPTCNYGAYSVFSKLLLSFCMLAGRLEIFPMLILFSRSTWKHQ